jgi:dipeptidyl aminopeptidase/acylaminoacyl peptidase
MHKFENREQVEFTNQGNKIFGVIHRPIGELSPPVVLFCHGLAGHKIGKHRMYVHLAESLARVGIASFRFDFRGSGDSEGGFGEMTMQGEIDDTLKAFEYICKQPNINTSRLGIFGRSFGGAIAIYAAERINFVKSIALWAPVYNGDQWEEQWEKLETQQLDEDTRRELMRINGQMPSLGFYQELITMNLENELHSLNKVPLLLIHGEKDPLVNISHSERYVDARLDAPGDTKFVRLSHSDHDFTHPDERLHATNITCQWFAKTL